MTRLLPATFLPKYFTGYISYREVDHFYQQLQETIDKTPNKDILVVQGDCNANVGKDARADWGEVCGP